MRGLVFPLGLDDVVLGQSFGERNPGPCACRVLRALQHPGLRGIWWPPGKAGSRKERMNADYGQWIEVSDASRPPNPTGTGSIPRRKRSAPGAGRPSLEQGAPPAGCPRPGSTRGPAHGVATGAPRGEAGSPGGGPAPGLPAEQGCLGRAPSPAPRESGKNWVGCPQRWAPKRGSSGRERGASGVWRQSAGRTTRRGNQVEGAAASAPDSRVRTLCI